MSEIEYVYGANFISWNYRTKVLTKRMLLYRKKTFWDQLKKPALKQNHKRLSYFLRRYFLKHTLYTVTFLCSHDNCISFWHSSVSKFPFPYRSQSSPVLDKTPRQWQDNNISQIRTPISCFHFSTKQFLFTNFLRLESFLQTIIRQPPSFHFPK